MKITFLSAADYDQIASYLIDHVLTAPLGAKRGELNYVNWMNCRILASQKATIVVTPSTKHIKALSKHVVDRTTSSGNRGSYEFRV